MLESLGIPPALAGRALLAYTDNLSRAAEWALDSSARHKYARRRADAPSPVDLQAAFIEAAEGSSDCCWAINVRVHIDGESLEYICLSVRTSHMSQHPGNPGAPWPGESDAHACGNSSSRLFETRVVAEGKGLAAGLRPTQRLFAALPARREARRPGNRKRLLEGASRRTTPVRTYRCHGRV